MDDDEARKLFKRFADACAALQRDVAALNKNLEAHDTNVRQTNELLEQLYNFVTPLLEKYQPLLDAMNARAAGGADGGGQDGQDGHEEGAGIDWAGAGIDLLQAVLQNRKGKKR